YSTGRVHAVEPRVMPRAAETRCVRISELTIGSRARCAPSAPRGPPSAVERSRAECSRHPMAPERVSRCAAKSARRPAMRAAANGRRIQETKNMHPRSIKLGRSLTTATIAVALAACSDNDHVVNVVTPLNSFTLTSLVADQGVAKTIDPNLVNPWGIAF